MQRAQWPGAEDGLGQSDVPHQVSGPGREGDARGGRCSKSVCDPSWHLGLRGVEWAAQAPGSVLWGLGGIAESFQLPDPVLVRGGPGAPVLSWGFKEPSLLGQHEWTGPARTFGIDICGCRACSPSGLSGFTGGQGWSWAGPTQEGSSGPVQCGSDAHLPGKHRSALPWLTGWDVEHSGQCWVLGVAHL